MVPIILVNLTWKRMFYLIATGFDSHNNKHPAAFLPPPPFPHWRQHDFSLAEHLDGKRWLSRIKKKKKEKEKGKGKEKECKNTVWVRIGAPRLQQVFLLRDVARLKRILMSSACISNTRSGCFPVDMSPCDPGKHVDVISLSLRNSPNASFHFIFAKSHCYNASFDCCCCCF